MARDAGKSSNQTRTLLHGAAAKYSVRRIIPRYGVDAVGVQRIDKPRRFTRSRFAARATSSTYRRHLRALNRVTRETKIPDADDSVACPLQQNEIGRRPRRVARIMHEQGRVPVHQPRNKMPVLQPGIVVEIRSNFASALPSQLGNEFEPHLLSQHVAYGVEVARVEALDVSGE